MLSRLIIHDVVLIEKLVLDLSSGLNVFTGETGAGKSILLDALGLALGERSDAALIRAGATQASVIAEFDLDADHAAVILCRDQGLTAENPMILRRVIGKDGKSRAFLNDQPISIGLLKQFGEKLLEIHGQFETHGLLNPGTHRGLLDEFAGLTQLRNKTAAAFDAWKEAEVKLDDAKTNRARAEAEEDFLRAAVNELDEIAPVTGEVDDLAARRTGLQHREKITEALQAAEQSLNSERGAAAALAQAGKAVARVADKDAGLPELLAAIDNAATETATAVQLLDRYTASIDNQPDALQRIEERLFALRAIARKHNVALDALPELQQELSSRLGLLSDQGDQLTVFAKQAKAAKHDYKALADNLSGKRTTSAIQLAKAIMRELPPLKFERARFVVNVAQLPEEQWSADGIDRVTFLAATNPGVTPGPLQKIASGGELARFMLALKVALAANEPVSTMVFDEVDAGVGGATASAVGERLAKLATHVQILVVTHSPQVAARGAHQLRVAKSVKGKAAVTEVTILSTDARRDEIARMLSGSTVTEAARQAAISLMDDASAVSLPKRTTKKA